MSADNGVYIARFISPKGQYEWRVAECQAICNCDYTDNIEQRILVQAIRVLYFGNKKPFIKHENAIAESNRIYNEILDDEFCPICEYGINEVHYDEPLTMTYKQAEKYVDDYYNKQNKKMKGKKK